MKSPQSFVGSTAYVFAKIAFALVLFAMTAPVGLAWQSTLFTDTWDPLPTTPFQTGKMIQDFSYAGYHQGEDPLPSSVAGSTYNVTTYGADSTGTNDSTVAIQSAINAAKAAGGGTVYLPAGTYKVSVQGTNGYVLLIDSSNILFRGAGVGQTFILNTTTFMREKNIIRVSGPSTAEWDKDETPATTITADLLYPTKTIPVASVSGFTVGDRIILRADPTDAWATENLEPLWVGFAGQYGSQMYYRQITAINATAKTLTIDIPIRYYMKLRESPRVYKKTGMLSEIGVENFSIANVQHPGTTSWSDQAAYLTAGLPPYDVHRSIMINFLYVRDSWIRNVETYMPTTNTVSTSHLLSDGIELNNSHNVTIKNCYFQRPMYGGGGGNGYMYRFSDSSDNLIIGSSANYSRHGLSISGLPGTGNVIHRFTDRWTNRATGATGVATVAGAGVDTHQWFTHANLFDVSIADNSYYEMAYRAAGTLAHGVTSAHGVLWNLEGILPSGTLRFPYVARSQQGRYGYIIGTRGTLPDISLSVNSTSKTVPTDHAEGVGEGATLTPFSLYEEQLRRRVGNTLSLSSTVANGVCGTSINSCNAGSFSDTADSASHYLWSCLGVSGGTTASCSLAKSLSPSFTANVFEEVGGIVAVEAEHFDSQSATSPRQWYLQSASVNPGITPDPDSNHYSTASGGAYIEALPDTRVTTADTLVAGTNFQDLPSPAMAILNYKIYFNNPGRYYVFARSYSTGDEDDGLHVGINGAWPTSGNRMQWCDGPDAWTWESHQRVSPSNLCGVGTQIYIDVPSAGLHTVSFSMREDGFEFDKFVLTTTYTYPTGTGLAEKLYASTPSASNVERGLTGFAWGSTVTGWLFFYGQIAPPESAAEVSLLGRSPLDSEYSATPGYVPFGFPLDLKWVSKSAVLCDAANDGGDTSWVGGKPVSGQEPTNPLRLLGVNKLFRIACQDENYVGREVEAEVLVPEVRCVNYNVPVISIDVVDSETIKTRIVRVPAYGTDLERNEYRTRPESYTLHAVNDDLSDGGEVSSVLASPETEIGMTITEPGLAPGTRYCRRIQGHHSVCGDTAMSAFVCGTTDDGGSPSWRINALSCGEVLVGLPTSADCSLPRSPASTLVGHWKFEETSGLTASDSSGNNRNGTLVGVPSWTSGGIIGRALSFDGGSDYVSLTSASNMLSNRNVYTTSFWAKAKDTSGQQVVWGEVGFDGFGGGSGIFEFHIQSGLMSFWAGYLATDGENMSVAVDTGWHHWVGVKNGTNYAALYKDGDFVGSDTSLSSGTAATHRLGSPNAPTRLFEGEIDDVRIYNRVLSAAEISVLYDDGIEPFVPPDPSSACGSVVNECADGTLQNTPDVENYYLWTCNDINNGVGPIASGEIADGDAVLAWDTTGTNANNVSCRLSIDPPGTNRTSSSADGSHPFDITESQTITFTCVDNFQKRQSREVFCGVACDIEEGCLECSFTPPNSPITPVVGDYVNLRAYIEGGQEPFSVEWRGDDLTYIVASTSERQQEFNKIYSTVGPKAISVTVTDKSLPPYTATCSLIADPNAPNAGPNLRVRGQIREI